MADSARARRLAKRIVAIVATELQHQVKDPRLALVTVTAATVTPDLREATVFYTVYGTDEEVQETSQALASATGVLRSAVGQQTGIKFTPTLAFKLDTVPENAHRIEDLLAAARAADAEVAERAAGASYAGDPDPYRRPDETEEEPEDVHAQAVDSLAATAVSAVTSVSSESPGGAGAPHSHDADIGGEDPVDRFGEPIEAQAGAGDRA
ncbi:MAG TPA: 30S ribosome-binding factor RbfA [Nakamurella sp.]|nr:30S ribosome-binding factor RbfA [Nakamurella sp.]